MDRRLAIARILVTLAACAIGVAPPIADFNETHVQNPDWPPHARLHTAWLVTTNSLIALLAVVRMWRPGARVTGADVRVGALLVGAVLAGFFFAAAIRSSLRRRPLGPGRRRAPHRAPGRQSGALLRVRRARGGRGLPGGVRLHREMTDQT